MGSRFGVPPMSFGTLASLPRYYPQQNMVQRPDAPPRPTFQRPTVGQSNEVRPAGPIAWNNRKQVIEDWEKANMMPDPNQPTWQPRNYNQQSNMDPEGRIGRIPQRFGRNAIDGGDGYFTQYNDPTMGMWARAFRKRKDGRK